MRPGRLTLAVFAMSGLAAGALAGCAADNWETPRESPSAIGAPAAGFAPTPSPTPEATVKPEPGSWDPVRPTPGYRVVLLTADDAEPTEVLAASVRDWAGEESVDLREIAPDADHVDSIVAAMKMNPDLIVSVGEDLVDPLALVTANHLDEQFLVLGAQVAEPTANVTSVNWTGAAFRGEGLTTSSESDPASFTSERGGQAIRAGTAAVLTGLTGVVLEID